MNTAELIENLARDARPVRPIPSPWALVPVLSGSSIVLALLGSALLGWRPDLEFRLVEPRFWIVATLLFALCGAGFTTLAALAIPGRRRFPLGAKVWMVGLVVLAGVVLSSTPWVEVSSLLLWLRIGLSCAVKAIGVGALPFLGGLWLARQGASAYPALSGASLGLVGAGLGAFALHGSCELSEPAHVLVAHVLAPGALLGAAGGWLGSRWLRW